MKLFISGISSVKLPVEGTLNIKGTHFSLFLLLNNVDPM